MLYLLSILEAGNEGRDRLRGKEPGKALITKRGHEKLFAAFFFQVGFTVFIELGNSFLDQVTKFVFHLNTIVHQTPAIAAMMPRRR